MREVISAGLLAGAVALTAATAAGAKPQPQPQPQPGAPTTAPAAPAAESYGVKTTYRAGAGKGYTARERHMADCLATYRGYDPASDRIVVRPGVTRPCEL